MDIVPIIVYTGEHHAIHAVAVAAWGRAMDARAEDRRRLLCPAAPGAAGAPLLYT